ncbi:sulfatase-like hydrolase/transferase [Haloterrigena alkaliphila]|uniref:Sulfatase-like hydrolase/transferase n=1 Tax=Haloterrigena alkaliphila TaxID=2816475 RepID=A0A8A2VH62_9EURY|nr:sulfatase-like hydrolase/transferase [Haloterrigena alkaliphila]QSW99704.1 sulfatase-like hydrolase/transferase [Haloterrigena alkaliphila]
MTDTTLLVTVDSLRTDHVQYMPHTLEFLDDTHDAAFATSTATPGSFPAIIGGEYPTGSGLEPEASVAHEFDARCVGITTNHLLSAEYDYATGFDSFTSPKGGGESLKDKGAILLERGSLPYKVASWGYNRYQQLRSYVEETEKSFRPADDVVDQFLGEVSGRDEWFGWLHFMEPHHPYDPDGADIDRAEAQRITRRVLSDRGSDEDEALVRDLYRREVAELDAALESLWDAIPDGTRVVFCGDHGELLGEDGLWGHPGEMRPELLNVPFGTRNAPDVGEVVSLIDVPTILTGAEHRQGTLDREIAFAAYGDRKAAMTADHIATEAGTYRLEDGERVEDPSLERERERFDPAYVVKEDALQEDLEDLGYA